MKPFKDLRDHAFCSLQRIIFEEFDAELTEEKIVLDMPNFSHEDVVDYLEQEGIEWEEKDGVIYILDPVEEAEITVEVEENEEIDEEFEVESQMLNEVAAKRKIVVRKGKKRIIFKCAPGFKKKGARVCVKRPASQLRKMKLTAKRTARKTRGKRAQAKRKRKLSLRKRLTFGLRPRKKK
jgi:uncharacterized protein involved in tellurium resistance